LNFLYNFELIFTFTEEPSSNLTHLLIKFGLKDLFVALIE